MPPVAHFDLASVDLDRVIADKEAIRKLLPQRFEMEQLDAIVRDDVATGISIGYKDVKPDEFWVRGHMPGYPLMPGVLMCEAAAQLCSYYVSANKLNSGDFIGFGGMEEVRFRGTVRPGDRLVLVCKAIKVDRRKTVCNVQAFVRGAMVFHGDIIGMPMSRSSETETPK